MIKQLTDVANKLDAIGMVKEADYLDLMINKLAQSWKLVGTEKGPGGETVEIWLNPAGETIRRPLGPAPQVAREVVKSPAEQGLDYLREKGQGLKDLGPNVLKYVMPGVNQSLQGDPEGAAAEQSQDWTKYHPGLTKVHSS